MVAVRRFIEEVWQKMSGMGSDGGDWVEIFQYTRRTLTDENLNLPQFRDNLFHLMPLVPISDPPFYSN